jgi:RNA polymerase sigma factor (sigma-70 family)
MAVVYIVDDDQSVLRAVARLIRSAGYEVISFSSADEFLQQRPADSPSCLVLDISMPGLTGMDLQDALVSAGHRLPIIFITGQADVPVTVKAMKRGALDFLLKPFQEEDLLAVIRQAIEKDIRQRKEAEERGEIENRKNTLTHREREVFELVITGMLNKQIAAELGTSEKTIKVHRARVMEKMKANSLAELVQLAERVKNSPLD